MKRRYFEVFERLKSVFMGQLVIISRRTLWNRCREIAKSPIYRVYSDLCFLARPTGLTLSYFFATLFFSSILFVDGWKIGAS
jgi:hypothetical protein